MIKYIIKKIPYVEGFVMCNYEFLKVSRKDLDKYLKEGWEIEKKEYPIFSPIKKFCNSYSRDKKTEIILVVIGALLSWLLSKF